MNFKSNLFVSLIDRITPIMKDGAKSVESPKKIYFKPSDVPPEELGEAVCDRVADDAVVAPFADRLIHPNTFGLTPSANNIRKLIETNRKIIDQCKDESIKEPFSKFYSKILDNSKNLSKDSHRMTYLMRSIEIIDNPNIKSEILTKIDFLNGCDSKKFKSFYPNLMSFMENFADAANSLNGKYMSIDNSTQKFYKWMDKNDIWFLDIIDGTKKSEANYRKNLLSSKTKNKNYSEYLESYDTYTEKGLKETFNNNLKQDSMKKFFNRYIETRKEAVDMLYHEEYLKTLSPDIAKECAEIQKEYNTYVITSNHDTTLEDIKYLKEELRLWKEAGKEEAVMPKILNINAFDEYALKNQCAGYANHIDDTITVRELLEYDGSINSGGSVLRHEMQHIHEQFAKRGKNTFDELGDAIAWNYNKIRFRKKWDKELENAGIVKKEHRDYAFKDEGELRSVTAESNMKKLSEKYKKQMEKKFEMQPWIFSIGENEVAERSRIIEMHLSN